MLSIFYLEWLLATISLTGHTTELYYNDKYIANTSSITQNKYKKSCSLGLSEAVLNNHQVCLSIFDRKVFSASGTSKLHSCPVNQTSFMENVLLRAR